MHSEAGGEEAGGEEEEERQEERRQLQGRCHTLQLPGSASLAKFSRFCQELFYPNPLPVITFPSCRALLRGPSQMGPSRRPTSLCLLAVECAVLAVAVLTGCKHLAVKTACLDLECERLFKAALGSWTSTSQFSSIMKMYSYLY